MAKEKLLKDPRKEYSDKGFKKQSQRSPGVQSEMTPVPDSGEKSYVGNGRLVGRKALITGGDSGIGRAVAIAFAREGADVAINYLPSEEKDAESLATLFAKEDRKLYLMPGDISRESICKKLVKDARKKLGGLDILVLNAGTQVATRSIRDLTTDQLLNTFKVNVFSMYWLVKEALPHMKPGTSIITTSSAQAFDPDAKYIDYAPSKHAVVGFTRALAKQVAKSGIRVNSVAPGPIWTPLQVSGGQLPEDIPDFGKDTLLGRAGEPAEVAPVYVFLASDKARFVTGEVYGVTGGMHRL